MSERKAVQFICTGITFSGQNTVSGQDYVFRHVVWRCIALNVFTAALVPFVHKFGGRSGRKTVVTRHASDVMNDDARRGNLHARR
jgi:hypothetical protein